MRSGPTTMWLIGSAALSRSLLYRISDAGLFLRTLTPPRRWGSPVISLETASLLFMGLLDPPHGLPLEAGFYARISSRVVGGERGLIQNGPVQVFVPSLFALFRCFDSGLRSSPQRGNLNAQKANWESERCKESARGWLLVL